MRVLLFTQHYLPDIGAQSFRVEALVKELINRKHQVSIITSKPHRYNLQEGFKFQKYEKSNNLEIYRISGGKKNNVFWRRPINYLTFMFNSFIYSLKVKFDKLDESLNRKK